MSEHVAASKVTEKAEQGGVLAKLIVFSLSLAIAPISSYYLSQKYLWNGDGTAAAITAVVAANLVLVAYIVQSVLEDKANLSRGTTAEKSETRKDR